MAPKKSHQTAGWKIFNEEDSSMKKLIYNIFIAAGAIFIASACSKNLPEDNNLSDLTKVTFEAGVEELASVTQAKAHFNDWESYQLYWDAEDKISVFSNGTNYPFSNTEADGIRASFEGQASVSGSYVALYPYNDKAQFASNKVSTTMPAAQTAVEHGTDKNAMIAVAQSSGNSLAFKNVYGILKFKIVDEDITSVTLEGNNNEVIAGDIDITVGDKPLYVVTGNASTEIVLNPVGEFFTPGDYAIVLLPVDFQAGFKLIFTHDGTAKAAIRATKSELFSVERNGGLDALNMEFEAADYKYYYIRTKEDLNAWHADYANWATSDKVYLANDIDYEGGTWVTQTASGTEFKGVFDGRGHSITNIHITSSEHTGFLRRVTGTVRNLTVGSPTDNSDIVSTATSSDRSMGGIVGMLVGGTIDNVVNYANLTLGSQTAYCGGIVGRVQPTTGESPRQSNITNCRNYGNITCISTRNVAALMGGIAGQLDSGSLSDATPEISGCHNYGNLLFDLNGSGKKANLGGVVGQVTCSAIIRDCYNGTSDVETSIISQGSGNYEFSIGGIIGFNQTQSATISNCTNYASISNSSDANKLHLGGIAGGLDKAASISNCVNNGNILDTGRCNDAYDGPTTDGNSRTGGILGSCNVAASLTDCVNNGRIENNSSSAYMSISGIMGLNAGGAASLLRCINTGYVGSTPVSNGIFNSTDDSSINQNIRIAGIVAKTSVQGTNVKSCENYGELKLNNSYKIIRNWIGGAVGYTEGAFMEDGIYYANLSRGAVGGGSIRGIVGRNAQSHGSLRNNGFGGTINGIAITEDNFNTATYMWDSKGWSEGRADNYFLAEKPNVGTVATPALSYNNDNQPW